MEKLMLINYKKQGGILKEPEDLTICGESVEG